jgi:serine/threonine-protein kinase
MKRCPKCETACWDAHKHCPACGASVRDVEVTPGDALINTTVGGKFVLREVIGEGAMGKVYRADQTNLGRTVAVKVMNPALLSDEGLVRRFHDEARSASRLNHPNIVSVIDFGQTESGVLYIVMEFLRGRTLARLIAEEAPLEPARIVDIMGQVLDALEEAHTHEVVHRDLKPDNIMVEALRTSGDFAKVLDFGIAKLRREDREFETVDGQCGTPEYMAPEQVRGQLDVDARADLYSLGIVMYEMLTGLTPFGGGSHAEVFTKQLGYAPKPPRDARPDVPISAPMEAVVLTALEKARDDRYPSAAAMKMALEAASREGLAAQQSSVGQVAQEFARELTTNRQSLIPRGRFPLPMLSRPEEVGLLELIEPSARARSIMLIGPDGTGKTTTVNLLAQRAATLGRLCVQTGPDPTGAGRPLYPIRQLCRDLLGLRGRPGLETLQSSIRRLQLQATNLTGLAELFGVPGDFSKLEQQARRRECVASALAAIRTATSQKPTVVVFEDVDRYDAPSREVVKRLLEQPSLGFTLVIATGTKTAFTKLDSRVEQLELEPFGETMVGDLAKHALLDATPALIATVMRATGGLPLHVEQALRDLAEGGEPLESLADTIGARIARLPMGERTLLQAIALAGGSADDSLLATMDIDVTPEAVTLLAQLGFLASASGTLRVSHPLIGDVAYGGIPEEARRGLHLRLWKALEAQHAEPMVLSRHAYETRERQAVPLLERAGEKAQREFDDPGAAVHFRRAVELQRWAMLEGATDAEAVFVRLSVKLGEALFHNAEMASAEGVLREALGYAQGNPQSEPRVRLALARLQLAWDAVERAERELRAGLRAAFKGGETAILGEFYLEFAGIEARRGDIAQAVSELGEGINLCTGGEGAQADFGPEILWRLLTREAELLATEGDIPAALVMAMHALRHARRVQSTVGEARAHALLGQLYEGSKEPTLAGDHRARALDLFRKLGDRRALAEVSIAVAQTSLKRAGLQRDTRMRLREAADLAEQVGWLEGAEKCEAALRDSGRRSEDSVPPSEQTQ